MRRTWVVGLVLVCLGCDDPSVMKVETPPLEVTPAALDFGRVWLGRPETRALTVRNSARVAQPLTVRVEGGFGVDAFPASVPPASEVTGQVTLEAQRAGPLTGTLWVGDAGVPLTALVQEVPTCEPSAACREVAFDFDAGECVETNSADGLDCTVTFACFRAAQCQRGECVGTLTTCDDGDPCTGDACGASGCFHYDSSYECPVPSDPCLAPSCDRATGCTSVPVVDGTPCGPRTCSSAAICLNGACQTRPAPQTQSCVDLVVGWPSGSGFTDGLARDARFSSVRSMQYHPSGDLFVTESENGLGGTIRRISPDGSVKTMAGSRSAGPQRDGFGSAARFVGPGLFGVDSRGNLVVRDGANLRRMSPSGLVSTVCTSCLSGLTWTVVRPTEGDVAAFERDMTASAITLIDLRTGATRRVSVTADSLPGGSAQLAALVDLDPLTGCVTRNAGPLTGELYRLDAARDAGLRWARLDAGCRVPLGAERALEDGSLEVLANAGPPTDGPITQVGLSPAAGNDVEFAFALDGGYALYDPVRFHVRRVEGGLMRTLAGPVPQQGLVDGAAPTARLLGSPRAMVAVDGGLLFTDEHALRRLEGVTATTWVADAGSRGIDLASTGGITWWLGASRPVPYGADSLTRFEGSSATTSAFPGEASSICGGADGGLLVTLSGSRSGTQVDGGIELFEYATRVRAAASPRRAYVFSTEATPGTFVLLEGEGNGALLTLLDTPDAGAPPLSDFYEVSPGVLVGLSERRVVRLDTTTRQLQVLAELSDQPTSIAPAPDGAYVGVPDAILHVRFP